MADWSIGVSAPEQSGRPYVASINTNGTNVLVGSVSYPNNDNCEINCISDAHGRSTFDVDLNGYIYDPEADPRPVTVSVILSGKKKGTETPDVQDE